MEVMHQSNPKHAKENFLMPHKTPHSKEEVNCQMPHNGLEEGMIIPEFY
jgi:hypothetical protein